MTAPPRPARDPRLDPQSVERTALRALLHYDPDDAALFPGRVPEPERRPRTLLLLVLALIEAALVAIATLGVSLLQVTGPSVALAAHQRLVAAFAEIDPLIAVRTEHLQRQIEAGAERLEIADFPVSGVSASRADALDTADALDATRLREALLREAASAVYERGSAAFGAGIKGDALLEGLADTLTVSRHARARTQAGAILSVAFAGGAVLLAAGRRRGLFALGLAAIAGGALAAALALGTQWLLAGVGERAPSALRIEEAAVARVLIEVPLRNGVSVAATGLALALAALRRGAAAPG